MPANEWLCCSEGLRAIPLVRRRPVETFWWMFMYFLKTGLEVGQSPDEFGFLPSRVYHVQICQAFLNLTFYLRGDSGAFVFKVIPDFLLAPKVLSEDL